VSRLEIRDLSEPEAVVAHELGATNDDDELCEPGARARD
jgi:hypothetical protein